MTKVKATVEIPAACSNKYEIDKDSGMLKLDRRIKLAYPAAYGFINNTLAPDGDALDCFIITSNTLWPLDQVQAAIYGAFICFDKGISDDKLLVAEKGDVHGVGAIRKFLLTYKKGFEVVKLVGAEEAVGIYKQCLIK